MLSLASDQNIHRPIKPKLKTWKLNDKSPVKWVSLSMIDTETVWLLDSSVNTSWCIAEACVCWISCGIEVEHDVRVDEKEDFTDSLMTSNLLSDKESPHPTG